MKNHLLVAGTGRAGTSLLVRYLDALGLETHITKADGQTVLFEDANAGLEDLILHGGENLPYVVKSPWLYQFADEVLENKDIKLDGVIIPIRNLVEAASSRTILELQNLHRTQEWMADESKTWDAWGSAPGGTVFSLNPLDQARLLAVGFHQLLDKLTNAGVPIYLLAFPRFTRDPEYLFSVLRGCLPASVNFDQVKLVSESIVEPEKVRVGSEMASQFPVSVPAQSADEYPSLEQLDNVALRREIRRLRRLEVAARQDLAQAHSAQQTLQGELDNLQTALVEKERNALEAQSATISRLAATVADLEGSLSSIQSSTSWSITRPLRKAATLVKKLGR